MIPLSPGTRERVEILFEREDVTTVTRMLEEEVTQYPRDATPQGLERLRFAVLRGSEGDLDRFLDLVRLAQVDWRDALVGGGFGDDPTAHTNWWPDPPG